MFLYGRPGTVICLNLYGDQGAEPGALQPVHVWVVMCNPICKVQMVSKFSLCGTVRSTHGVFDEGDKLE
jgi:hypothetical protein